jgi:DNA-binding FrmR family transcriptional regulator
MPLHRVGEEESYLPFPHGDAPLTLPGRAHDSCVGGALAQPPSLQNPTSMNEPSPDEARGERLLARACACRVRDTAGDPEGAPEVDALVKGHLLMRLQRIERQVRGIQMMLMDDDYCGNVMNEIVAAHGALRGAGREVIRNHLRYCSAINLLLGPEQAAQMLDEVVDMVYRLGR